MGRPSVNLEELLDDRLGGDLCLSYTELARLCGFEIGEDFIGPATPCSRVWPLGFG